MNKVMLIGNVAHVGEVKETSSGKVLEARIAVPKGHKKDDGAHFFTLEAWDKLADVIIDYAPVGRQVAIVGELNLNSWTNDAGEPRSMVKVKIRELELLGSPKPKGEGDQDDEEATAFAAAATGGDIPF